MKIYLATWFYEPSQGEALTSCNQKQRLISYYHTQKLAEQMPEYVAEGIIKKESKKKRRNIC
jgi:hypothetical protein